MHEDLVIETHHLTKRYGARIVAVDDLHLTIRRGEVYGFLGPNGAGKTTTLRMLLGLIRPTTGTARILGEAPGSSRSLERVGAMVESPAFYPYLSGRDNLHVVARYAGVGEARVEKVLAQVGLTSRAGDKFGAYSLGMKQRLGVAAALMKDPQLLILDEPTNGLDPVGMLEMRTLIRELGRDTRSVLLSSHLLGEVEQICDRVGIIRGGRLVAEGTVDELRGEGGLLIRALPLDEARRRTEALVGAERVHIEDNALLIRVDPARASAINRALVLADVEVLELRRAERSLEDVFFALTERQSAGAESIREVEV